MEIILTTLAAFMLGTYTIFVKMFIDKAIVNKSDYPIELWNILQFWFIVRSGILLVSIFAIILIHYFGDIINIWLTILTILVLIIWASVHDGFFTYVISYKLPSDELMKLEINNYKSSNGDKKKKSWWLRNRGTCIVFLCNVLIFIMVVLIGELHIINMYFTFLLLWGVIGVVFVVNSTQDAIWSKKNYLIFKSIELIPDNYNDVYLSYHIAYNQWLKKTPNPREDVEYRMNYILSKITLDES